MKNKFSTRDLSIVIDQALIYQCACPAQVCNSLIELRELYDYQINCIEQSEVDKQVHKTIAESTAKAHAELEICLEKVLHLEGWNRETLEMPDNLKKKPAKKI